MSHILTNYVRGDAKGFTSMQYSARNANAKLDNVERHQEQV